MPARGTPPVAPLYDPQFEHDACGIGFVADAGGRNRQRVLPLAISGLAALGHRGAFGADGESSDGAGVALPLEPALVDALAPRAGAERPAVVMLFLPRSRARATRARTLVAESLATEGLAISTLRRVPTDASALGAAAAETRPDIVQAIVPRPTDQDGRPLGDDAFERRLVLARRRLEGRARAEHLADLSVPSASSRTIVYKGRRQRNSEQGIKQYTIQKP